MWLWNHPSAKSRRSASGVSSGQHRWRTAAFQAVQYKRETIALRSKRPIVEMLLYPCSELLFSLCLKENTNTSRHEWQTLAPLNSNENSLPICGKRGMEEMFRSFPERILTPSVRRHGEYILPCIGFETNTVWLALTGILRCWILEGAPLDTIFDWVFIICSWFCNSVPNESSTDLSLSQPPSDGVWDLWQTALGGQGYLQDIGPEEPFQKGM